MVLFIALTQCFTLWGQLHCINFTIQDGLPAENVLCATEDQDGFMWFGTSSGICQFDGIDFINYSSIGTGNSPGGVYVSAIEIDKQNNLWVGTEKQGIYYLDRKHKEWTHFSADQLGFLKLRSNEIFCFYSTEDGLMWYGSSEGGLGCIDILKRTHDNYDMYDLPRRNTWQNRIYDIAIVPNDTNKFYVAGQGYVYKFNQEVREFETINFDFQPKYTRDQTFDVHTIAIPREGELWLGTWNSGIKSFDAKNGTFKEIYPLDKSESINWRSNVYAGAQNEVWITDRQKGIGHYNIVSGEFKFYKSEPYNRNGLLKADYNVVYHSSQNKTWVLTNQGISLIVPQYQAFSYFQNDVENTNFFLDIDSIPGTTNYIASFAGEHGPLKLLDQDLSVISTAYFRQPKDAFQSVFSTTVYNNEILCISADLLQFLPRTNQLVPYEIAGLDPGERVKELLVDQKDLWLLMGNGSLAHYNGVTDRIKKYPFDGYHNTDELVFFHGMEFVGDKIWIATNVEIVQFDKKTETFKYFSIKNDQLIERKAGAVIQKNTTSIDQIAPVNNYSAWVLSSGSGLYLVSDTSGECSITSHRDKSLLDQLQSPIEMIEGINNDYWIATMNGLVHADSLLESCQVYGQNEGLRSSKLSQGIKRIGGELFIGMPKGFAKADTRTLMAQVTKARVSISDVFVNHRLTRFDSTRIFNYRNNDLVIHVASPNYHESKSVTFASRLMNHNDEWQYSDAFERVFRYDNLKPGKYRFDVKARSAGTQWSDVESYSFRIQPPFWKTNWFRLFVLFGLLVLGYLIYRLKLKRDLQAERIKTKLASLEGRALRAQMNPHFIFNSLNSIKSLILLDRKEEGITYLTKFSTMVREILTLSSEKAVSLEKELKLLQMYLTMESLRFQQKFEYKIEVDPSVNIYAQKVPPLLIQPYVENSIWHGLLHKDGDAHLNISVNRQDAYLVITIEDDGIGRKASGLIKSEKSIYNKKSEGLKLSKSRIDLVSEYAYVNIEDIDNDELTTGTRVTIKLPANYGKEI